MVNAVDATYQQQLREYSDLNWLRFKAHMDSGFAEVRREVAESRADMIKWMFVFQCGNMIGLGGLIVALKLF